MRKLPRHMLLVAVLGLAGLLAACSTSGDSDSSDDTVTTEEQPESTIDEDPELPEDEDPEIPEDDPEDPDDDILGDEDMSRDEMVDQMAEAFVAEPSVPFDDADIAHCVAEDFVDILGEDLMELDEGDIDEDDALELAGSFRGCGFDLEEFFVDNAVEEGGASKEEAECVIDEIGVETLEEGIALAMIGGDTTDLDSEIEAAQQGCVD